MTGSKKIFTENAQDWNEVVSRRVDPQMTKFKAMSLEEQVTYLEQIAQEILRAQEGTASSESSEEVGDPWEDIKVATVYPRYQLGISLKIKIHKKGVCCYIIKPSY
jgi:hypothetical protein